jgi:SNW domain-containing protein 1
MFDARLFNQSHGMSSGFGDEEDYSLYDKPLFNGVTASAIYRPSRASSEAAVAGVNMNTVEAIVSAPSRGFSGADQETVRDGPVQFEKEADPFGFSEFMGSAKRGREADDHDMANRKK